MIKLRKWKKKMVWESIGGKRLFLMFFFYKKKTKNNKKALQIGVVGGDIGRIVWEWSV